LLITPATSRATAAAAAATSSAIATPTTPAANGASQVFKPTGRLAVSENPLGPFAPASGTASPSDEKSKCGKCVEALGVCTLPRGSSSSCLKYPRKFV